MSESTDGSEKRPILTLRKRADDVTDRPDGQVARANERLPEPEPQPATAVEGALDAHWPGVVWNDLRASERIFSISHLRPFDFSVALKDGSNATVVVDFGHHVFTDEKEVGPPFRYQGDLRYLSEARIARSQGLPTLLRSKYEREHSRACRNQKGGRQYFMLEEADYAIFYRLQLDAAVRRFSLKVVSAYPVAESQRLALPGKEHHLYENRDILFRLMNGGKINYDRKKR
ncbi:MAG: hypothetical protein JSR78_10335 [Proteobacteria bacterium]|nr:hypothetical protein [Pseudomonadota bacterium]